jgi:cytoskeletal protein RodZ
MTEQPASNPQTQSTPVARTGRRRPSLYRTVLSLGIAAVVAVWLPFSMFYITAVNKRATPVSMISAPHSTTGTTRVVTTTSGATQVVSASASNGAASTGTRAATPIPVSTRTS